MRAVCSRCGADKPRAMGPCPDCGFLPAGPDRPIAYLFSSHHLSDPELNQLSARIQRGQRPDPRPDLLEIARSDLTATTRLPEEWSTSDPGLTSEEQFLLLLGNVALTPLIGAVFWWGWRKERPVAARQALKLTLPVSVVMSAIWASAVFF